MALGFYQVLVSLSQTFHLDPLPDDFAAVIGYFKFLGFDWTAFAYPVGCINGYENALLLITSLSPLTLVALVLLVVWTTECKAGISQAFRRKEWPPTTPIRPSNIALTLESYRYSEAESSSRSPSPVHRTKRLPATRSRQLEQLAATTPPASKKRVTAVYISLLVIFICLTSVSRAIFSTWVCEQYEVSPGKMISFLVKDLSVECYSEKHYTTVAVALAMLLLWPVGMLALFGGVLFYNRKDLRAGEPRNTCAKAASFLTSGYRNEYFYWETVELGRRLLVSGWVLLIPTQEMFLRLISTLFVSVLFLVLTAIARPWSRAEDNMLALVSQGALVVALGCCLVIKIINVPGTANEELDDLLGFPDAAAPYFVLCFVALGFLFVMVAVFAATVHRGLSSLVKNQAAVHGGSVPKYTSTAFSVGACLLGLPAGALAGYAFGVLGGVVGAAVFGALGAVLGVAVGKALRNFAKKAAQKLSIRRQVVPDELLETGLQDVFDELMDRPVQKYSLMDKALGGMITRLSSTRASRSNSVDGGDTCMVEHAGKRVREQLESIRRLIPREEAVEVLTTAAKRMRSHDYSLTDFHSDMVKCFPELQLYLGGNEPAADTVQASATILKNKGVFLAGASTDGPAASSGRTGHVEYCRTFGALFCVYWLMRLELDEVDGSQGLGGQSGFCFGVDAVTWEATPLPLQEEQPTASAGAVAPTEESKKRAFLLSHNWKQMHELMVDAGLLTRTKGGGAAVCVERTRAMLVLTAIHDVTHRYLNLEPTDLQIGSFRVTVRLVLCQVMKIECLLPTLLVAHAPFGDYQAGEQIRDHDAALGYILTYDTNALPSYADLPPEQRSPVCFTQAELSYAPHGNSNLDTKRELHALLPSTNYTPSPNPL